MQRLFFLSLLIFALASCLDKPVPPATEVASVQTQTDAIVGTWEASWLIVGIDTINNSENSALVEIAPSEWNEKVKTQPTRCRFNDDGSYVSWIYDTGHKMVRKCIGHWMMDGELLTIEQQFPSVKNMTWKVRIPKSMNYAEFFSKYDFDGDGKNDDNIYCQMKKLESPCISDKCL